MCAKETNGDVAPERGETTAEALEAAHDGPTGGSAAETKPEGGWQRRKFLAAAALGTAAAALLSSSGKDIKFGPIAAYAHDLSNKPCTANDVTVLGSGHITNYCTCQGSQGTFTATVEFSVQNGTGAGRYCVGLHLVDGKDANGNVVVPTQDVILINTATNTSFLPANSTSTMRGSITGFPCNSTSVVKFGIGNCGDIISGKCGPDSCSTVSWNTSTTAANCTVLDDNPPGGQCRHQTICVQGFGATLSCTNNCTPACGATATLVLCAVGGTGPFTFSLAANGNAVTPTSSTATCATFDVPISAATTLIGTVQETRTGGCSRSAQVNLTANPISVSLGTTGAPDCQGNVTFQASPTPAGSYTYEWKLDGNVVGSNAATYAYTPDPDCTNHTVSVKVSNAAGCNASATKTINQVVTTTIT